MAAKNIQYEAMFLLGPGGATEPEAGLTLCRQIIERHGGEILVIKKWDERRLAYEIEGQKRGTYIIAYFKGPGPAIASIERDVNLSEQVLRVLVTRADHLNAEEMAAVEPQPIQPREERNPWDRPSFDRGGDRGGERGGDRGGERRPRREEPAEAGANKE
jgi:small subunit ribosomal protein S6